MADTTEAARLAGLRGLNILDSLPERDYDDVVRLASVICGTPVALMSMVDRDRQWFKARVGLEATETPVDVSFCKHAIAQTDLNQIFEIPDATADARFAENPLVTGPMAIRFYAGAPLVTGDGLAMGALCVIDQTPRTLSAEQKEALTILARSLAARLDLRRRNAELTAAADSLAEEHNRFRSILDNSAAFIYVKDRDSRFQLVNQRYADRLGRTPEQCVGLKSRDLYSKDIADKLLAHDQQVWDTQTAHTFEERVFFNGTETVVVSIRFPLTNAAGEMTAVCGISTDITARKHAEAELLVAMNDAERLSAEAGLARQAADEARAIAESASLAKSEFLATMSHEIRTPLNGVVGMADLLAGTPLAAEQIRFVKVLKTSADSLLSIINQILDFSKIEAGRLEIESIPVDVPMLVRDVIDMMAPRAAAKGLKLTSRVDPDVSNNLTGDPVRLRQILVNLISNAVKFTETGGVDVRLSARTDGRRTDLRVDVVDTGIGIPADRRDRWRWRGRRL